MDRIAADFRGVIMAGSSSTNSNEYSLNITGDTVELLDGDGNVVSSDTINHPPQPTLVTTTAVIRSEEYFAMSTNGTTQASVRQMSISRTAVGRWNVTLSPPHPDGLNYHPSFTAEEQSSNRDTPDITIVQGTRSSSGFEIQITTGDNGGAADVYIDTPFSIGINSPITVLTGVLLV